MSNSCFYKSPGGKVSDLHIPRGVRLGVVQKVEAVNNDQCVDEILEKLPTAEPPLKVRCPPEKEAQIRKQAKLDHLNAEEKERFLQLLIKNHDTMSTSEFDIGNCTTIKHRLNLKTNRPIYVKQFPIPSAHQKELNRFVDNWLKLGIVKESHSEWNSPIFLVPKPGRFDPETGEQLWRPVVDFREINRNCYPSNYRLPTLDECMERIGRAKAKFFTSIDLRSGFNQLFMSDRDKLKTSFHLPGRGSFYFERAPFGLASMPFCFARAMDLVFRNFKPDSHIVYLDDCLLMSRNFEDTLATCQAAFDRFRAHKLKIHLEKTNWHQQSTSYLGVEITPDGYRAGKRKIEAIAKSKPPTTVRSIRSWLGLCGFFRASIPHYAQMSTHLSSLTKKDSKWHGGKLPEKAFRAFKEMKEALCKRPVLGFPTTEGDLHLFTDASLLGLGAVLVQEQKGRMVALGYASRTLLKHEKNYGATVLETLGMTFGIEKFRAILTSRQFTIHCDHRPAQKLSTIHTRTLSRLQQLLLEFTFDVVYRKGTEQIADWPSRHPVEVAEVVHGPLVNLTKEELSKLQWQDEFCGTLLRYLVHKTSPTDPEAKKLITRYASDCYILEDVLYIKREREGYWKQHCICAPALLHADIVAAAHSQLVSGHTGIYKTCQRVLSQYFWPNVQEDVKEAVAACKECQMADRKMKPNAPLGTPPEPEEPLSVVHMDLLGPMLTDNGKKFILVLTDSMTKFTKFVSCPSKKPEDVAEAIFRNWIADFGCCHVAVSDQGKEFCSKLSEELFDLLKIDKRRTSAFNPKCNASSEIRNKHAIKYLTTMLQDGSTTQWESLLPAMQLCYNASVNKATKHTPYFLLFNVHPRTPFGDPNEAEKKFYGQGYIDELKIRLEKTRRLAKQNNLIYRTKYAKDYDKKIKYYKVTEGDVVLLHRPEMIKINPKISSPFDGPYVVLQVVGQQNVLIQHLHNHKTRYVNVNRIKKLLSADMQFETHSSQTSRKRNGSTDVEAPETPKRIRTFEEEGVTVDLDPDVVVLSPDHEVERHRPIPVKTEHEEEDGGRGAAADDASPAPSQRSDESPFRKALGNIKNRLQKQKEHVERRADEIFDPIRPEFIRKDMPLPPGSTVNVIPLPVDQYQSLQKALGPSGPSHRFGRSLVDPEGRVVGYDPTDRSSTAPKVVPGPDPKDRGRVTRSKAEKEGIRIPEAQAPPAKPPEYRPKKKRTK